MALKDQLKALRTHNNLTQEQVAHALGIKRNSVTAWEKGIANPSVKNLNLLTKLYSVSMDEIFGTFDDQTSKPKPPRKTQQTTDKRIKIPVRGYAQGNYVDIGNAVKKPIGFLDLAPSFANIVDLYAVYITGDSMSPVHEHGDTRLVAPHNPVKVGDTVVYVKKAMNGQAETSYIKILAEINTYPSGAVKYHFDQFNPIGRPDAFIVDLNNILQIHKVLTYDEILGL